MRHSLPLAPQFYVTAPQPCPYLEGRMERKLFTALQGDNAQTLNDSLSKQGFRRSQNVLYRPSCSDCAACMSARIVADEFRPSRSQRKSIKRNAGLVRRVSSPWATEDQYDLFRRYLDARHATGGMADMDVFEFAAMIEETPIRSRVIEYSDPQTDQLVAVCLTDMLDDGLSMVYSFYDPAWSKASLGTWMILDHVEIARQNGLPYVYLGYWVPGSDKMGYKAQFSALEVHRAGIWERLVDPDGYEADTHPLSTDPIAEQVANISLPDTTRVLSELPDRAAATMLARMGGIILHTSDAGSRARVEIGTGAGFEIHEWSGSGPGYLHVHHEDDEAWHVISGRLRFRLAEGQSVEAGPGTTVYVPAGVAHDYADLDGTSRYLMILTPRLRALIDALHAAPVDEHPEVMRRFASEIVA